MKLTDDEKKLLTTRFNSGTVRPAEQWAEILGPLTPPEAAARIFGDLQLYRSEIKDGFSYKRRDGFLDDVEQLANALNGWVIQSRRKPSFPIGVPYLCLSTGHVTKNDMDRLDSGGPYCVASYDYGAFVFLEAESELDWRNEVKALGFSDAFCDVLEFAKANGCDYVRLDADGDQIDGLKFHEW